MRDASGRVRARRLGFFAFLLQHVQTLFCNSFCIYIRPPACYNPVRNPQKQRTYRGKRGDGNDKSGDYSGGYAMLYANDYPDWRSVCEKIAAEQRKLLSGRAHAGAVGVGHERRGVGYERLSAHGRAGAGLLVRAGGRGLDGRGPDSGHVHELAAGIPAAAQLFGGGGQRHHRAGFSEQSLSRKEKGDSGRVRRVYPDFLHGVRRQLLCHLRKAVRRAV